MVDLGTGDGSFVYQSARAHPDRFYIGIDAEPTGLREKSTRASRKAAKGGVPNVLFVVASVEQLPAELAGVADEVHVHFPWGSLLRAFALGEQPILEAVRGLCVPGAWLEVVAALDPLRDRAELARLGLVPAADFPRESIAHYGAAGFEVTELGQVEAGRWPHLETTWAKRLQRERSLSYLIARAL